METKTQTWKPRRSTTITRIANELSTIQIYEGAFKTRAYDRFDGFLAGLQYMHLLNDKQVEELRELGMRARGSIHVPLPEGDELRESDRALPERSGLSAGRSQDS